MNLSKTAGYALRVLTYMARNEDQLYTALSLHEALKIPDRYLRRLLTQLAGSGIMASRQGVKGGYHFAKSTDQIFISDIIDAVDGPQAYTTCILGFDECVLHNKCVMHSRWAEIREKTIEILSTTSLADMKSETPHKF